MTTAEIRRAELTIAQAARGSPDALGELTRLVEAARDASVKLERARAALVVYANPDTWHHDSWGVPCVNAVEYGNSGQFARDALSYIDYVAPQVADVPVPDRAGRDERGTVTP